MPARPPKTGSKDSTAHLGFEAKLWLAADKLRNNMDAAEYKHVVLGLIFLKYISDTAGKCRSANSEVRTRNARPIRHSKYANFLCPTSRPAPSSPPLECRMPKCECGIEKP
jgi:hypothetical protein